MVDVSEIKVAITHFFPTTQLPNISTSMIVVRGGAKKTYDLVAKEADFRVNRKRF